MQKHPPLKGAIIGFGFISGKGHAPAYVARESVTITAVADISEARRLEAQKIFPKAKIYPDYQTLLRAEASNLDFVDISTPPASHAEVARAALDLNLHVLCEKPLTTNLEDALQLARLAQEKRRVLFPCHNYKSAPVVRAIRSVIESGRIGVVRSATLGTFRNTHAKGVPEWNTNWRRQERYSGGGIAMDHGSHSLYLAFDWMKSLPNLVTAKATTIDKDKYDTEDNFSCVLTFPTGVVNMQLCWTAGIRKMIYNIQGTKGGITVDDDNIEIAEIEKTSGPDVAQGAVKWNVEKKAISSDWMDASHVGWFQDLFDRFEIAISAHDYLNPDLKDALMCVHVITCAYQSARQNSLEIPVPFLTILK